MIDGWWMDVCISPSPSPAVVCSSESMTAFNSSAFNLRTPQKGGGGAWALYGVLQLPNRLACSDDTSSAPNICRQSCKSMLHCFTHARMRACTHTHTHTPIYIYIYINMHFFIFFFNRCVSASTSTLIFHLFVFLVYIILISCLMRMRNVDWMLLLFFMKKRELDFLIYLLHSF